MNRAIVMAFLDAEERHQQALRTAYGKHETYSPTQIQGVDSEIVREAFAELHRIYSESGISMADVRKEINTMRMETQHGVAAAVYNTLLLSAKSLFDDADWQKITSSETNRLVLLMLKASANNLAQYLTFREG